LRGLAILVLAVAAATPLARTTPAQANKAVFVNIEGMVHPVTTEIVSSAIQMGKRDGASVLVLRLNTPGGLMDAMRDTIQLILASPIPVITYVAPSGGRSASAGFFILEAGDVAAMAPGTNTGAAHPVVEGGEIDAVMKQKLENDAAAYMRSICAKRNHNANLAETAVRESKSFTDAEALNQHLIDLVEPNDRALLDAIDGRSVTRFDGSVTTLHTSGAAIEQYSPSLRQRIISAIADPNIALILLVVGGLCLYIEFTSPGMFAPGVVGAICVLLALSALSVLPIDWLGAGLLIVAFTLFALEAKFPTHGVLAVGGAVAMILGAVMLINAPQPEMRIHWITAIALALPFSVITAFLLSIAVRARRAKAVTGAEGMIGEEGAAITELAPEGKIFVRGEYWDAVSLRPAPAGARVKVTAIDKLKLTVEPIPERSGG
jgi:membrane-bound serine protease (ClpP class)